MSISAIEAAFTCDHYVPILTRDRSSRRFDVFSPIPHVSPSFSSSLLRYLVYASVSRCTREQLFQPFRKMRRGQGQGQVCQRIIVLSISRSPRPMCFSAQAFPLTANGCKLRRELYFFNFCILEKKFVFRRYVIKFCSGELLNDYE